AQDHGHHHQSPAPPPGHVKDPVCGMTVDPQRTPHHATHAGNDYHFCSAGCRQKFIDNPQRYLQPTPVTAQQSVPEGTWWTCPMHPEIRQQHAGPCPICGMALEPELVSLADAPNAELLDMTRRFYIALTLTLPVFI